MQTIDSGNKFFKYVELVKDGNWEYIRRTSCEGIVIVLIYDEDAEHYLTVEQYRPPIKQRLIEFPAGLVDEGETPAQAAMREVSEEIGYILNESQLIDLGYVYSAVGITDEKAYLFAAIVNSDTPRHEVKHSVIEKHHNLKTVYLRDEDIVNLNAAKALSIYYRFLRKREDPRLEFK